MDVETKTLKPGFCCFGITDKCMLKCKMCYKWMEDISIKNTPDFPSIRQWNQCVSDLAQMVDFPFELDIGGGEALMFEGVLDVVRFSVGKGFNTSIASNGFLIDEDMAKKIADSGLKSISISMDSLNEKTHDYLRGINGVYSRAMKAIEYLHKHCKGIYINLCCVFYGINQEEVVALAKWADKNDRIGTMNFMAAMQPNNTAPENNWWQGQYGFIWPKDTERMISVIQQIIDLKKSGCKIGNFIS
jgi:MoaA/NifB/PqqE/SkfB family radical SAM enzyme